jgi:hypothetical protein
MPSQWDKLCEILERAETMPAKSKADYVQSSIKALAYECYAAEKATRALRSMPAKMKKKRTNGHKPRKKAARRYLNLASPAAASISGLRKYIARPMRIGG